MTAVGIGYAFTSNQSYMERLESTFNITTDGSNLGRIYVWEADKQMIMDHPMIGWALACGERKYKEEYKLENRNSKFRSFP